jgi:hypothetical protein
MKQLCAEEWDFGKCPDTELVACCLWEYHREAEDFRFGFDAWRRTMAEGEVHVVPIGVVDGVSYGVRSDAKEFPSRPWLAMNPKRRASVLHRVQTRGPAFETVRTSDRETFDESSGVQTVLVQIDWALGDERIKKDFAAWLKVNRPSEERIDPSVTRFLGRGKTPRWADHLRELSALRLRRVYGSSTEVLKMPAMRIYSGSVAFNRAAAKAKELVRLIRWEPV